jgi:hypothetical protein
MICFYWDYCYQQCICDVAAIKELHPGLRNLLEYIEVAVAGDKL